MNSLANAKQTVKRVSAKKFLELRLRDDKKRREWKLAKSTPRKEHFKNRVDRKRHILNEVLALRLYTSSSN